MKPVRLDTIDRSLQVRERMSPETVEDYHELYESGAKLPPPVVFENTAGQVFLADGFHRVKAAELLGIVELPCDVRHGTRDDALWYACGANRTNGMRMGRGDVAHAIRLALDAFPDRSQREIAEQVGCSREYVNKIACGRKPDEPGAADGESVNSSHEPDIDRDGDDPDSEGGDDGGGASGDRQRGPAGADAEADRESVDDALATIADRCALLEAMMPRIPASLRENVRAAVRQLGHRMEQLGKSE